MLPSADLDYIAARSDRARDALRGARIFVTGAAGFVGSWLAESGRWMNLRVVVHRGRRAGDGDIRDFVLASSVTHVVHCASAGDGTENAETPDRVVQVMTEGTRRVAEECARVGAKLLHVSSCSVYDVGATREGWGVAEDHPFVRSGNPFAVAKVAAERFAVGIAHAVVARVFPLHGPRLPSHLLAADLMRRGLQDVPEPITIAQGTLTRSYLYAADAAAWLWHLLAFGMPGEAVNVGSDWGCSLGSYALMHEVASGKPLWVRVENALAPPPLLPQVTKMRRLAGDAWCDVMDPTAGVNRWRAWEREGR